MRYKSPLSLLLSAALLVSGAVCTDVRGIGAEDHTAPADMSAEEIISRTEEIDAKIASSFDKNGFCAAELTDDEFDTLQLAIDLAAEQSGHDEDLGTDSAVYMSSSNCIHGWYYDQLTDIQKQMYDAVGDSCESYLAGDLSTVSSRGYFDIVTMDVNMSGDEIRQVFYAFFYSNPQYFFLPSQVGYSNGKNPSQLALTSNTPCRDAVNRHDQRDRIEQLSTEWMTAINEGTTVGAKTKILADTISAHVVYETMTDENVKDSYGRPLAYQSILTPMLYGKSICTGYAMTVNFMARKMGLDCIVVTSNKSAAEAHAWNRIKIGETWYEFDTTWYDKESGKYDDRWLLRSSASFSELDPRGQHAINTDFILYKDVTLPVCTEDYKFLEYKCGQDLEWSCSDGRLTIIGSGDMYELDESPWADVASEITSVYLPDGITYISKDIFKGTAITSVEIPTGCIIGSGAFMGTPLTSVDIPEGCTIGNDAFKDTDLTSVELPKGCSIGSNAFSGTDITRLDLTEDITMDDDAFTGCPLVHIHLPFGSDPADFAGRYGMPADAASFYVLDEDGACSDITCPKSVIALRRSTVTFGVKGVFGGRNVTFGSVYEGADIYYSYTTGSITTDDLHVKAGDTVLFKDYYGTIYARTYINGTWGTASRLILKIPKVNEPTIAVTDGYAHISTTTPLCYIIYTTDGSEPSLENGTRAYGQIKVKLDSFPMIRAIAIRSCFTDSPVAELTLDSFLAPPSFTVTGTFGGRKVVFDTNYSTADIYFSTTTSSLTTDDHKVKPGKSVVFSHFYGTLYARAYLNGRWSNVSRLILKIPDCAKPQASQDRDMLVIRSSTPDSYIIYTTDESVPSITNGTRTKGEARIPFLIGTKVRAIAVRSGFSDSEELRIRLADPDEDPDEG